MQSIKEYPAQYYVDRLSIASFAALYLVLVMRIFPFLENDRKILGFMVFAVSGLLADFVSGVVHWAADTWGTAQWPVIGAALIGPFREHHADKYSITRHDFAETNGNNCLVSIPVLIGMLFIPHLENKLNFTAFVLLFGLMFWIFLTNQFHKWSHTDKNPTLIEWLQKKKLILPRDHHDLHHHYPHTTNYCITNGWMNPLLNRIQFFPRLELLITKVTGAQPRHEDLRTAQSNLPTVAS